MKKVLVKYNNGKKEVFYMMKDTDIRLDKTSEYYSTDYNVIDHNPKFKRVEEIQSNGYYSYGFLETNQGTFVVFSDWSARKI